jgi:hypothetical protein
MPTITQAIKNEVKQKVGPIVGTSDLTTRKLPASDTVRYVFLPHRYFKAKEKIRKLALVQTWVVELSEWGWEEPNSNRVWLDETGVLDDDIFKHEPDDRSHERHYIYD